jgi:hypothetical protein
VRNDNTHPFKTKDIPVIEHDRGHEIDTKKNKHVDMLIPQRHAIDDKIDADEDERVDAFTLHRHVMDDTRTSKRNPRNVEEQCSSTENISNQRMAQVMPSPAFEPCPISIKNQPDTEEQCASPMLVTGWHHTRQTTQSLMPKVNSCKYAPNHQTKGGHTMA